MYGDSIHNAAAFPKPKPAPEPSPAPLHEFATGFVSAVSLVAAEFAKPEVRAIWSNWFQTVQPVIAKASAAAIATGLVRGLVEGLTTGAAAFADTLDSPKG